MNKTIKIILAATLAIVSISANAVTFDPDVRYSVQMLDARLAGFNNKGDRVGFTTTTCPGWDYVPGLVGKATLDAWNYYKDANELDTKTSNWYGSIYYYGEQKVTDQKFNEADDLDILNAAKIYCRLYQGATTDAQRTVAKNGMQTAMDGINKYVNTANNGNGYKIASGPATGGWWHKNSYTNQMWCDGQYMGPALLAQLIEYNTVYPALGLDLHGFDWEDVVKQLDIAWEYLWNPTDQLLWHVFTTDTTTTKAKGWYDKGNAGEIGTGTGIYHSSECWSRACGWYIMALVDILESMDNARYTGAGRARMITQLQTLAAGLACRQDAASGCWYQLPKYTNTTCATYVDGNTTGSTTKSNGGNQCNYLESSGTCAFVASILKGIRLGYIDKDTQVTNAFNGSDVQSIEDIAKRGYQGIITNFINGSNEITSSCESAGLDNVRNGTVAYYLIGKDDPINNNTEGKAFGPFILAAVEYERAYLPINTACNCLRVSASK